MSSVEDRQAAQRDNVRVLLRLIDEEEISSIGDDHWVIYDDTVPCGHRVTDPVEGLIRRKLAQPKGYYDIHLTAAGLELLEQLNLAAAAREAAREVHP